MALPSSAAERYHRKPDLTGRWTSSLSHLSVSCSMAPSWSMAFVWFCSAAFRNHLSASVSLPRRRRCASWNCAFTLPSCAAFSLSRPGTRRASRLAAAMPRPQPAGNRPFREPLGVNLGFSGSSRLEGLEIQHLLSY